MTVRYRSRNRFLPRLQELEARRVPAAWTDTWIGGSGTPGTAWGNDSNWSSTAPGKTHVHPDGHADVVFDPHPASAPHITTSDAVCDTITLQGGETVYIDSGGTLTLQALDSSVSTVNGPSGGIDVTASGGTLSIPAAAELDYNAYDLGTVGNISVGGKLLLQNSITGIGSSVTVSGTMYLTNSMTGNVTNYGSLTVNQNGALYFDSDGNSFGGKGGLIGGFGSSFTDNGNVERRGTAAPAGSGFNSNYVDTSDMTIGSTGVLNIDEGTALRGFSTITCNGGGVVDLNGNADLNNLSSTSVLSLQSSSTLNVWVGSDVRDATDGVCTLSETSASIYLKDKVSGGTYYYATLQINKSASFDGGRIYAYVDCTGPSPYKCTAIQETGTNPTVTNTNTPIWNITPVDGSWPSPAPGVLWIMFYGDFSYSGTVQVSLPAGDTCTSFDWDPGTGCLILKA